MKAFSGTAPAPRGGASFDAVVVGGGIAGLASALLLSHDRRVLLLEREPLLAAHASGRNAAIFRPLELDVSTAWLARRSLALCAELELDVLRRTGLLLAAADIEALGALHAHAREQGVGCELIAGRTLHERAPLLAGGEIGAGLWLPDGGVLDIHALTTGLAARLRAAGGVVQLGSAVVRVTVESGAVHGVELDDGTRIAAPSVVLAAGAWGSALGAAVAAPLPLVPQRRHLVQLDVAAGATAAHPVVWRVDEELYFRPESGGVLCSPCDATPSDAGIPVNDPGALELLAGKLARSAPGLAAAPVRRAWACLRTFAPDAELVVGADPRIRGLCWLGALGGRGMGVALGAGELLAQVMRGERSAAGSTPEALSAFRTLSAALSPARLVA